MKKINLYYILAGGVITLAGFYILGIYGLIGTISLLLAGAIIILFGSAMPARTHKGVLAKEHILGLKNYLI